MQNIILQRKQQKYQVHKQKAPNIKFTKQLKLTCPGFPLVRISHKTPLPDPVMGDHLSHLWLQSCLPTNLPLRQQQVMFLP